MDDFRAMGYTDEDIRLQWLFKIYPLILKHNWTVSDVTKCDNGVYTVTLTHPDGKQCHWFNLAPPNPSNYEIQQ